MKLWEAMIFYECPSLSSGMKLFPDVLVLEIKVGARVQNPNVRKLRLQINDLLELIVYH